MNIAFIPVRGGSKSIKLKNIKPILGKPLVYWTVKAACQCEKIDEVYVSTDSDAIRDAVLNFAENEKDIFSNLKVVGRTAESASDTASTEFAMLEFAKDREFDNIVLIQATSPMLSYTDLNRGFAIFESEVTDSVLSVVKQKRFNWSINSEGYAVPTNYDVFNRPRRQEFNGYFVENGAFYITSQKALFESRNRLSGNIKLVEMDERTFFEIDEPSDWVIVEGLMKQTIHDPLDYSKIKLLVTDCDGCLTDGGMYYSEKGDELKKFNTKDGMAFKLLREKGIKTGIITGEKVDLNRRRAEKLKVDYFIDGCTDKSTALKTLCNDNGFSLEDVVYIGDDVNDLDILEIVGFSVAPQDATQKVKDVCDYVTKVNGGCGVIREVADLILKNND